MKKILSPLLLTSMALMSNAQPTNGGFENWDTCWSGPDCIYPSGWPLMEHAYLYRSSDAYEGNYALTVNVWYSYIKTAAIQEEPISSRPAYFNGYYKYTDAYIKNNSLGGIIEPDTAEVVVALSRWNSLTAHRDTIGYGKIKLTESLGYTPFSCPLSYTSTDTPDTVIVILDPSRLRRYEDILFNAPNSGECSYFTTDKLSFGDEMLGITYTATLQNNIHVYPNPFSRTVTIEDPGNEISQVVLYNAAGIAVPCTVTFTSGKTRVDAHNLVPGIYTLVVTGRNGKKIVSEPLIRQ